MTLWDELLNRMNDDEWAWWPFTFLRPPKHVPMTNGLVMTASVLYGVLFGMIFNVILAAGESSLANHPALFPAGFSLVLFVFYRLTFARAWNRRAARLRLVVSDAVNEATE